MNAEPGFSQSLKLPVEGMRCASGVCRMEHALETLPGVSDACVTALDTSAVQSSAEVRVPSGRRKVPAE